MLHIIVLEFSARWFWHGLDIGVVGKHLQVDSAKRAQSEASARLLKLETEKKVRGGNGRLLH